MVALLWLCPEVMDGGQVRDTKHGAKNCNSWDLPGQDTIHLIRVHLDTLIIDDLSQELHFSAEEVQLGCAKVQLLTTQDIDHSSDMLDVFY